MVILQKCAYFQKMIWKKNLRPDEIVKADMNEILRICVTRCKWEKRRKISLYFKFFLFVHTLLAVILSYFANPIMYMLMLKNILFSFLRFVPLISNYGMSWLCSTM